MIRISISTQAGSFLLLLRSLRTLSILEAVWCGCDFVTLRWLTGLWLIRGLLVSLKRMSLFLDLIGANYQTPLSYKATVCGLIRKWSPQNIGFSLNVFSRFVEVNNCTNKEYLLLIYIILLYCCFYAFPIIFT